MSFHNFSIKNHSLLMKSSTYSDRFKYSSFKSILKTKEVSLKSLFELKKFLIYASDWSRGSQSMISSETTAKGTGLAESAGKEDPDELDFRLTLWSGCRISESFGAGEIPPPL